MADQHKHPGGRPTDYSAEIADEFCRRVASGRSTFSVCADIDMPSDTTVYRWRQEKPEFRDKVALARDERLEAYADRLSALATRVIDEPDLDPQRVNAAANAIDKAARLQAPKQRIEVTGKDGGAIETNSRTKLDLGDLSPDERDALRAILGARTRESKSGAD